ncbi:DUF3168 domain-containing protein [Thermoanaerobacterium thermosaccharolyticum]|uniref:DUF3168 domain-containing protein n=1 Tax=Thermoanaerobacterium thermosaccharolyticum TaxID=1517 RepID=UPI003DA9D439
MKSPIFPLQKAIYERLKNNLSCPVYDRDPDGAAMPYVTIGEDTAVDWSTKLEAGQEVTHTLHIWSDYNGMMETKQLINTIIQALTLTPLQVEGFFVVIARLDMVETMRDPSKCRHGIVRFRFKIQEQ